MRRGRILIVEDEADLAWVEQFNLEGEGYDVRVDEFQPHVMILDLMLPLVNGWDVLAKANELPRGRRPLVIVVSAVAGARDQVRAEDMGVGSFLQKPFDMDDLVRMVSEKFASNGRPTESSGPPEPAV